MIRALVKADQVRVWGESAIVPHNPACRCSFIWMKRSKKKGFVKARPPCAAAELSSSLQHSLSFSSVLPLSLFLTHFYFLLVFRFLFASLFFIGHKLRRGQRRAFCLDFCLMHLFNSNICIICM